MAGAGTYGYRLESGGAVGIRGLKEVNRALRKLGDATKTEMKETHREAGNIVARAAKPLAPVRTGRLASTIVSAPTQRQGRVRVGRGQSIPYAGPIHFGWPARRIAPQPFIYEALDNRARDVHKVYERRINELVKEHNLGVGSTTILR